MRIALLGLPQSGKRTLFHLLTGRTVPETRKAGETIEGQASVPDPRVDRLSEMYQPRKTTYAQNHYLLCPDIDPTSPSRAWLKAARQCDLLCMLVRAFESDQVYHPSGSVDPLRDRADIETELILGDLEVVLNRLARIEKEKKAGRKAELAIEERALHKCEAVLEQTRPIRTAGLDQDDLIAIRSLGLITMIPTLWVNNVSEKDMLRAFDPDSINLSCQIEQEIATIEDPGERAAFLRDLGIEDLGSDRLNAAAYASLGLMSFYTVGKDEVRAWTVQKGAVAPRAGGKIHSDIERGFIRVEIIKYADLLAAGSEKAVKDKGLALLKGRDYVMEDGDICHFLFNV
jgi:ribosome-binding ATPase